MCCKSESIKNLAIALVKFNAEMKIIEKDATNPHFKNHYASLDTIIDEVRPLLAKHGLSMMQFPGGDGEKFTLRSMLLHESGEWIESEPITMRPVKNDPQGIGSCSTYARRYGISAFLNLNTGEDDDGNGATHKTSPSNDDLAALEQASQTNIEASKYANSDQVKMLNAKAKAAGYTAQMKDDLMYMVTQLVGYHVERFEQLEKKDVNKLARQLDKQKSA